MPFIKRKVREEVFLSLLLKTMAFTLRGKIERIRYGKHL